MSGLLRVLLRLCFQGRTEVLVSVVPDLHVMVDRRTEPSLGTPDSDLGIVGQCGL